MARITHVLPKISLNPPSENYEYPTTVFPVISHLKYIDSSQIILMEYPGIMLDKENNTHNTMEFEHQLDGASLYCVVIDLNHSDIIFHINYFIANKHVFCLSLVHI